jgi:hypothetical protein
MRLFDNPGIGIDCAEKKKGAGISPCMESCYYFSAVYRRDRIYFIWQQSHSSSFETQKTPTAEIPHIMPHFVQKRRHISRRRAF